MEWLLEFALAILLALTLFHALRLERALGVLQRDRAALEELVAAFNESTRQAEQGVDRLRNSADGVGRQIARQVETASSLKDDLAFLVERGDRLADRLDALVRLARPTAQDVSRAEPGFATAAPETTRLPSPTLRATPPRGSGPGETPEPAPRLRSQAERDLLKALRTAR